MAVISRLPGGGVSKNKLFTTFDIKKVSNFGDVIKQTKFTQSCYPYGGIYYEETSEGVGKLFVQVLNKSTKDCYIYVYSINGDTVTKLKEITIANIGGLRSMKLNSDKNSSIIVLSNTLDTMSTIYYINKSTYTVSSLSAPMYNGAMLSIKGATVINGYIYLSTWCNLSQPYLYKYDQSGTLISSFSNSSEISALYGNTNTQCDADGNFYLSFDGNTSNTSSYIMTSVDNTGKLRWRKSMANLGVKCGAKLLSVRADGLSIWYLTASPYSVLIVDKDGVVIKTIDNFFTSSSFSINHLQWDDKEENLMIQDVGGRYCYLTNDSLEVLEKLDTEITDHIASVWMDSNKLILAKYDSGVCIEIREPYSTYKLI